MQFPSGDFDELDLGSRRSHSPTFFHSQLGFDDDDHPMGPPAPRQQLRRTQPIDFSLHRGSTLESQMSGSTLHTQSNFLPRKAASSFDLSPRLSIEAIRQLTPSDLEHNHHYRDLRDDFDYLNRVFARYLGKDLRVDEPQVAKSDNRDVFHCAYLFHSYALYILILIL